MLAPKRKEALRREFDEPMGEFHRALRDVRLSEDGIVRLVRTDGAPGDSIAYRSGPAEFPGPAGGGGGGEGDSGGDGGGAGGSGGCRSG